MDALVSARAFVCLVCLLAALIAVLLGVTVLLGAHDRRQARAFAFFCLCAAGWSSAVGLQAFPGFFEQHRSLIEAGRFGFLFLPAAMIHLLSVWLWPANRGLRIATLFCFGLSGVLTIAHSRGLLFAGLFDYRWGTRAYPGPFYPVMVVFMCGSLAASVLIAVCAFRAAATPLTRLRAKYLLLAAGVCLPLGAANFLPNYGVLIPPVGILAMAIFLMIVSYALLHRQLLDIDVVAIKALAAAYSAVAVAFPVLAIVRAAYGAGLDLSQPTFMPVLFVSAAGGAAFFTRLRVHFEREVENSLFPSRRAAREAVEELSRRIIENPCRSDLAQELVDTLGTSFGLLGAAFYVRQKGARSFELRAAAGEITCPLSIELTGPFGSRPEDAPRPDAPNETNPPCDWKTLVPIGSRVEPIGVIVLGGKRSAAALSDGEDMLLSMLASQVAVALNIADYIRQAEQQEARIQAQQRRLAEMEHRLRQRVVPAISTVRASPGFGAIVGSSPKLLQSLGIIERVARSRASVLIIGETGTGKELAARAIHTISGRKGSLVTVNCAAIPNELAEATFFGYERGAFTGAVESHPGKFEAADGGTIVLDEIGELSMSMQTKLLRVLQEQETQRIGSHQVRKLDVRVVATTNRDLLAEVEAERFRRDLYYRLATIVVDLPPLRERSSDIPLLASHFLQRAVRGASGTARAFTAEAMDALQRHGWPGNVRELENVIQRAVLLCDGEEIGLEHLSTLAAPESNGAPLRDAVRDEKSRRIRAALLETGGNKAKAARMLGMTPSNLSRLMKNLGFH